MSESSSLEGGTVSQYSVYLVEFTGLLRSCHMPGTVSGTEDSRLLRYHEGDGMAVMGWGWGHTHHQCVPVVHSCR